MIIELLITIKSMAIRKNNITRERDQFTVVLEAIQSDFQIFGEKMEMIEEKKKIKPKII